VQINIREHRQRLQQIDAMFMSSIFDNQKFNVLDLDNNLVFPFTQKNFFHSIMKCQSVSNAFVTSKLIYF